MTEKNELKRIILEIIRQVEDIPSEYRLKAFEVLLANVITESAPPAQNLKTSGPKTERSEKQQVDKKLSLPEFVKKIGPKSAPEYVVTIGHFLEKQEEIASFKTKDIKAGFTKVKYKHSNPSQAMVAAETQGLLMDGTDGGKVLTSTAEEWVEKKLSEITT